MECPRFLLGLLLLSFVRAAPQGSPACGQVPANPAAGQIRAHYLQIPGCGGSLDTSSTIATSNGSGSNSNAGSASTPSVSTANLQHPTTNATALETGAGKCPAGFRNTIFNTGASRNAGWPQATWNSLTSNGVEEWSKSKSLAEGYPSKHPLILSSCLVGFALSTLDTTSTYNTGSGPALTIPSLNAAQIHQLMDPTEVSAAVQLLQSRTPQYLTLFNEPDYSYQGLTPLTSATDAANDLQPLFAASHPSTT